MKVTVQSMLVNAADRRSPVVLVAVTDDELRDALRSSFADDLVGDDVEAGSLDSMTLAELVSWCEEQGNLTITIDSHDVEAPTV